MALNAQTLGQLLKIALTGSSKERNVAVKLFSLLIENRKKSTPLEVGANKLNTSVHAKFLLEAMKEVAKNPPETV